MALDPEEYKQRRIKREQERQAKQARLRKTRIRLLIAAAVLIATGVLIFATAGKGPAEDPGQTSPGLSEQTTRQLEDQTAAPGDTGPSASETSGGKADTVIRIAAAGDLNINEAVVQSGGSSFDYKDVFLDVAHLLGDADITVLNLEGVLTGPPYGSTGSAPSGLLEALRDVGVDMIQYANSYSIHKGMAGLTSTLSAIRAAGLEPLGAYASNEEFRASKGYTIREIQGVKIAFIAFTKGMNGMALPAGNEHCVNVLYTDYATTYRDVDSEKILSILNAARKESPDAIVTLLHWGSEYNDTISSSQNEILELLLENGVDVILGTHSHYVQKMMFDPINGTFATYSLGDFLSDTQRSGTEYSVILEVELTKSGETGKTTVTDFNYTPIFNVAEEGQPMRLLRIREAMTAYEQKYVGAVSEAVYSDMSYALGRINTRIEGN